LHRYWYEQRAFGDLLGQDEGLVEKRTRVREAVINAVVHADYAQQGAPIRLSIFDGRLEIENPGLLPFGLTIEDLRKGISKLRNRVIGRVFRDLGLIEQWGSGIQPEQRARGCYL
jgi:predicted HTH transcriptional regulator